MTRINIKLLVSDSNQHEATYEKEDIISSYLQVTRITIMSVLVTRINSMSLDK